MHTFRVNVHVVPHAVTLADPDYRNNVRMSNQLLLSLSRGSVSSSCGMGSYRPDPFESTVRMKILSASKAPCFVGDGLGRFYSALEGSLSHLISSNETSNRWCPRDFS